jgi:hypothetical protein
MSSNSHDIRTHPRTCPTHGHVQAQKKIPKIKFPFFVYGVRRLIALLGPYRCPECGAKAGAGG